MSRLFKTKGGVWLVALLMLVGTSTKHVQAQPNVNVSFQTFYNELSPYGNWINYGNYGYCWTPNVDAGFRPYYSNGYWANTAYGNTWVSNYSWGWAPFHYGRWVQDNFYGWIWVPGNTWGPAWVSWRNGGGMYGWAPMAPGVNINIAISPRFSCSPDWWVFVPQRQIYARNFHNHWRGPRFNNTYINNTTIINNTYINNNQRYVMGPRSYEVERATGQRVRTYGVRTSMKPGRTQVRGNEVNVYNPRVTQRRNERPQRIASASEIRRSRGNTAMRQGAATQQRSNGNMRNSGNMSNTNQRVASPRSSGNTTQRTAQNNPRMNSPRNNGSTIQRTPQNNTRMNSSRGNSTMQRAPQNNTRMNSSRSGRTAQATPQRNATRTQPKPVHQPRQQNRITERRQQSWQQQQRQSRPSQSVQRSTQQRPNYNRSQSVQRSRPQTQQRSRATQSRPHTQQRTMQRSSGSSTQRSSSGGSRATSRGKWSR